MQYFFIGLIWILALNTVRLFLREVRKRHIEVREWIAPNMLPNDFIVRDTIGEMCTPLIVMLIAAGILTYFLLGVDWIEGFVFYLILIGLALTFVISWFTATDRITWYASIKDNFIKIIFFLNFKFLNEAISVEDITIERRSNGAITLFNNDIRLFSVYTGSAAYDLMVEFLQENKVQESTFTSRNFREEKPIEKVATEEVLEEVSEYEKIRSEIIVRKSKRLLWLFVVMIILNIPIMFISDEFRADNRMLLIIVRIAILFIATIISSVRWKVTAQYQEVKFRNRIGFEKSYPFFQVSKVDVVGRTYHLFYDSGPKVRRMVKIHAKDKNAKEFLLRLFDRGIPFYQKGMMVTRADVLGD